MDKPHNLNALIRIEDAIKVLCRKTCNPGVFCPDTYCDEMWDALADIERVDAAPVVRCKDCTYSKPLNAMVIECTVWADARLKTDFCSAGERKDGERHD